MLPHAIASIAAAMAVHALALRWAIQCAQIMSSVSSGSRTGDVAESSRNSASSLRGWPDAGWRAGNSITRANSSSNWMSGRYGLRLARRPEKERILIPIT